MTATIFVDGASGSAGLELAGRLAARNDIRMLRLEGDQRRDTTARLAMMRQADITALCLPSDAARAIVAEAPKDARIIDASVAHRLSDDWEYGFPEWAPGQDHTIAHAHRVATPGCYAMGMVAAIRPLTLVGALDPDAPLAVHGVSGYSGGGKALIEEFETAEAPAPLRLYGLGLEHKHTPEMQAWSGMRAPVCFLPSVVNMYRGMLVSTGLRRSWLGGRGVDEVHAILAAHYAGSALVRVCKVDGASALDARRMAAQEGLEIHVMGRDDAGLVMLTAALDNLNFGAAATLERCVALMLGLESAVRVSA